MFEKLAERLAGFVLQEFAAVGDPAEQVIKAGNHEDADHGAQ